MDNKRVDGTVGWSLRRFGKPVRRLLVALALRARLRRTGSLRLLARGVHADLGAATGCGALAWVGGRFSPPRCFRLRIRTDRTAIGLQPRHAKTLEEWLWERLG